MGHLYKFEKYKKMRTKLYTVLHTVLTRKCNWNLSTLNYLKFNPYGFNVWSASIQRDSLLSLSFGYICIMYIFDHGVDISMTHVCILMEELCFEF